MNNNIIVAGGGHGGIGAASLLAARGYDVTVYERHSKGALGYDWTDIFAPSAFDEIEMAMPSPDKYEFKENMTFYGPGFNKALKQRIPYNKLEIKMERRDIYEHIISDAEKKGVKFVYDCEIKAPIVIGDRVVGISSSLGDFYGCLIIDSCGLMSPLRSGLPASCGVNPEIGENNSFYVYRAFYNRATEDEAEDKYKVCLFAHNKLGIGWVATEEKYTDLLIGRFEPFDMDEVERTAALYRKTNPSLGETLLRGGQFVRIPVRQPLSKMVCDGYAAIGDSAYMTVPIIGSGIANSFRAARMLADAVCSDISGAYSAETLWKYQLAFYKKLGSGFAALACVKEALTVFTPEELDYMLENGILTSNDVSAMDADFKDFISVLKKNTPVDIKNKISGMTKNMPLLLKMLKVGKKISAVSAVCAAIPPVYNKRTVDNWIKSYEKAIGMKLK